MLKLVIADKSEQTCRATLDLLLAEAPTEIYVVGWTTTAERLRFLMPQADITLIGTELADGRTLTLLPQLKRDNPQATIVLITRCQDLQILLQYVEWGIDGYVIRDESTAEMWRKMRASYQNEALVSPDMAAALMRRLSTLANRQLAPTLMQAKIGLLSTLTPREREVLALLGEGHTNSAIAAQLAIARGTVKNHVHSILQKLNASNRQEAGAVYHFNRQKMQHA